MVKLPLTEVSKASGRVVLRMWEVLDALSLRYLLGGDSRSWRKQNWRSEFETSQDLDGI